MNQEKIDRFSENKFATVMAQYSDDSIRKILWERNSYQPQAQQAAIHEALKRQIITKIEDVEIFFPSPEEIEPKPPTEEDLEKQDMRNDKAEKDMLYGGLWFVGGLLGTISEIGFIFWGAILFGGFQFVRGLSNRFL